MATLSDLKAFTKANIADKIGVASVTRPAIKAAIDAAYDFTVQLVGSQAGGLDYLDKQIFSPVIDFLVRRQRMETVQTSDLFFSLSTVAGQLSDAAMTVVVRTDGIHTIAISADFWTIGPLTEKNCDFALHFYQDKFGIQPQCRVVPLTKGGVPGGAISTGGVLPTTQLATPQLGTIVATADGFTANWTNVADEDGYRVRYSQDINFATVDGTATPAADVTSLTTAGLVSGATYYVQVQAIGSGSRRSSGYSASKSILVGSGGATQLAAPLGLAVTTTTSYAQVSAQAVANATQYGFEASTTSNFSAVTRVVVSTPSAQFTGLLPDTLYYFRSNASAIGYATSAYSAAVSKRTLANTSAVHAYAFNGPDQTVTLANSAGLFHGFQPFTWLFNAQYKDNGHLYLSQGAAPSTRQVDVLLEGNVISVQLTDDAGNYLYYYSGYVGLGIDNWVVRWNGNTDAQAVEVLRNGSVIPMNFANPTGQFNGIGTSGSHRLGAVNNSASSESFLDYVYGIDGYLTNAEYGADYYPNRAAQLSTANRLLYFLDFEGNLLDETGKHNGTAVNPQYVTALQ